MAVLRFILLAALLGLCPAEKKRYDGYKVLRVTPGDDFQLQSIVNLERMLEDKVDFWASSHHIGKSVDLMVSPEDEHSVQALLDQQGLESTVWISDVQQLIDETTPEEREENIAGLANFRYDRYHSFDDIIKWMKDVAAEHPNIASTQDIGSSYEKRVLSLLKLGKPGNGKPIFWLMSGTHAREWLSPATLLKIVDLFLTNYGNGNSDVVNLLDKVDFYLMPMSNPDGYEYSRSRDRMWRKTRSTESLWCTGTDPNRNWDINWGGTGSSGNPCSQTYRGSSAFSEIEVKTVADYVRGLQGVKVFIDLHAYSQYWTVPYGYKYARPPTYTDLMTVTNKAMAALKAEHGLTFATGTTAEVIYLASGISADWAYEKANIPYCFAPELRDKGYYGFLMPESQILPSAEEVFAAIKVIGNYII
ncbi:carboxypeptidase B-like [Acanthaster planci]|uniref:Carboxypeptidase B-like n=1 Tax=Acanthaster planci TaxID=133434 RepID=A0A8B7ZD58_ACAPL|nr:carboxypeptidase B-like [Acanthaster planci]